MRSVVIAAIVGAFAFPAVAQSAEDTAKAIDCLALTELAKEKQSVPDTAQVRTWQSTVETSQHCKRADEAVAHRVEAYRQSLRDADDATRFALELMIESEAEKCVSGVHQTSYERGV